MSWLHKTHSTYGRLIPKPEVLGKREEISDEAIPIQDQIENLRAKISLKERYNKALQDDLMESNEGASSYILELSRETKELRQKLVDAIDSEKSAVQNALRTHREFQLAMTNKTPAVAVPWLDDKLFDMAKLLNSLLDKLKDKRKRLEESEQMVITIEKWPRPGTLPWEVAAHADFSRLECLIEAQKVKRETSFILHSKYIEIKYHLLAERGKYTSILKNMEAGLRTLKNELNSLETMLDDAIYFRNEAFRNLTLTEKEASENRKRRRIQMSKMKKAVERILEENQHAPTVKAKPSKLQNSFSLQGLPSLSEVSELLKAKRTEVEEFQGRARRLVETMRVPDLTHIPIRLKTVSKIGFRLMDELDAKEKMRDLYIKQRAQLNLILYYFRYTGITQLEDFYSFKLEYDKSISEAVMRQQEVIRKLDKVGSINLELRLGILSILDHLNTERKKGRHYPSDDMMIQMKVIIVKIRKLIKSNEELQELFKRREPEKNYSYYVKPQAMPNRLIRVGTPHQSEDSDAEDDFIDSKVPGRMEIKAKSARFLNQAMLKRGIH